MIDAIRCAKLAIDRNISGVLVAPSAAYMKAPPIQMDDAFQKIVILEINLNSLFEF